MESGRYDPADLMRLRERLNMVDLVERATQQTMKRVGGEWRGRCPFEPSSKDVGKFAVTATQYHCFGGGCGKGGDVFQWFQDYHGVGFVDAVQMAAREAGMEVQARGQRSAEDEAAQRRRDERAEVLALIGLMSREQAERQVLTAPDILAHAGDGATDLVAGGTVGWMPNSQALLSYLRQVGMRASAVRDVGLMEAVAQLSERWVLWAREGDRIVAGRPLGASGPIIGQWGGRTKAWASTPVGERRGDGTLIAGDDALYLALRGAKVGHVIRPLHAVQEPAPGETAEQHVERGARDGRRAGGLSDLRSPPVVVVQPTGEGRREGLRLALGLLGTNARLRVGELALPARAGGVIPGREMGTEDDGAPPAPAVGAWADQVRRVVQDAGVVLDWQLEVLAAQGALATRDGITGAVRHLERIVEIVGAESVEGRMFRSELEGLWAIARTMERRDATPVVGQAAPGRREHDPVDRAGGGWGSPVDGGTVRRTVPAGATAAPATTGTREHVPRPR